MLKNHLKIAWRNLTKNKLQTSINLLGLTVGMVSCLCILVYVLAQFGYDTHHENTNSLYKVISEVRSVGNSTINSKSAGSSPPIAFALKEDYPEIEEACRVVYFGDVSNDLLQVKGDENSYYESRGYVVDSTFFNIFKYQFIEGASKNSLNEPNSVVLSSTLAKKLFGNEPALNKTLVMGAGDNQMETIITGVFDDKYAKSHLNPNYLLTMNSPNIGAFVRRIDNYAIQNFANTYLKLNKSVNAKKLEQKFPDFLDRRASKHLADAGFEKTLSLQAVKDIHLHSKGVNFQLDKVSDINYLYSMLALAALIIIVACINFINLSTARANKRAKEIGVRKAIGANRKSLTSQFLGESVLISLLAVIMSIPLTILLLPFLNDIMESNLLISDVLNIRIILLITIFGIITGLLAGFYPAIVLSAVKPIKVLRGSTLQIGNINLRKSLVVFQFVVSCILIVSVIIITQQLQYAQNKKMGFDKENLVAIRLGTRELSDKYTAIKQEFDALSDIKEVTGSNHYPSMNILGDLGMHLPNESKSNIRSVFYNGVSENYFNTVGTKLITGRTLRTTDSIQVVVNKATLDVFNIPVKEALGKIVVNEIGDRSESYEIVGVSENYHFASLKEAIKPLLLYNDETPSWLIVKAQTSDYKALINSLETTWKRINPHAPFVYNFVDDNVQQLFKEEQRLGKLSITFTILAILISCLGLFGLVSYVAEQKKKEIGIRKVLGASVKSVVSLITKDFVRLVLISLVIATPIAYLLMQKWLEDFVYRIEIKWWVFALAGCLAILITFATVGFQSIKAAMANPTKSLRTE